MPQRTVKTPARFAIMGHVLKNPVLQLAVNDLREAFEVFRRLEGRIEHTVLQRQDGSEIALVARRNHVPQAAHEVFLCHNSEEVASGASDALKGKWLGPSPIDPSALPLEQMRDRCVRVLDSWSGRFLMKEERRDANGAVTTVGLRPPQIGAFYSVLGHWRMSSGLATVVMPTGTGKTETMLALYASERFTRLLVVVPTNALRQQVGNKFLTMGHIASLSLLIPGTALPVVGYLEHEPKTETEVDEVFLRCNVVVTTM